ncbi:31971_t:CDS:2 [Gigaspora margarita]|uniref:31971_t:CDS:1 n=1 Tax=Gigaspora margarita TaxID=4874 RepID=A0ABN7UCS5_GIGMA|nr:31971_t:CDS:2 [Gigaspora margarita]
MASTGASSEKTSVQVALRIRPLTEEDVRTLPPRFQRQVLSTPPHAPNQVIVSGEKKQSYNFDHVFNQETSQSEIFEKAVLKLIDKFIEGKTYTMGTSDSSKIPADQKGIVPRAMRSLFDNINSPQYKSRKFQIKVSFIEIYNEDLIDLLGEGEGESRPQVTIREDSKGHILWSGLQEIKVNSADEVMGLLSRGSSNRQVGATDMNQKSSRSHAIFSVTMIQHKFMSNTGGGSRSMTPEIPELKSGIRPPSRSSSRLSNKRSDDGSGEWTSVTSKFHFVDLAGSERTGTVGDRVKEGISINSGLLALGNVISALGDISKAKQITHIPYRDSKLTRLLQDSLGGNAQTLMIACVSGAEYNLDETVNTLKYANRARNIKNSAFVNQEEAGWNDIEHLQTLVIKLRNEIKALRAADALTNGSYSNPASGRSTPLGISGRETPSFQYQSHLKRPSTPLSINMALNHANPNHKDLEVLEDQLSQLQRSYADLTQKYAKVSAELAQHQDNSDDALSKSSLSKVQQNDIKSKLPMKPIKEEKFSAASFQEAVEPVIEEYEKSISALENLESKLESQSIEQQKDQDLINELKNKISQLKSNGNNSEGYIQSLESRLATSEEQLSKFRQNVGNLEKRLQDREAAYQDLENRMRLVEVDDTKLLLNEIDDRDKRISQLEEKVELLMGELDKLRELSHLSVDGIDVHERSISESSAFSNFTSSSQSITPLGEHERMNIVALEVKLSELQKTHENTVKEFDEMKDKYQSCIAEIDDLRTQLVEAKLIYSEMDDNFKSTPSTPMTPMSPMSSNSVNSFRFSLPTRSIELSKEALHKTLDASKRTFHHRKARSLSAEIKGSEKRDLVHLAIMQKLNNELKQLSSLHEDKDQGLVTINQEFAKLEMSYRETLELVEELREEIKRRDALAQLEVMSVITSDHSNTEGYTPSISEIDKLDIVQRLREEVEQLKEEQKLEMEHLSEYKKEKGNSDRPGENADASKSENENDELLVHQRQIEKLQVEIESKSHTIAALLLPNEYQNTIRRLEDELQEVKEAHRIAMKEKYGKSSITSETAEEDVYRSTTHGFTSDAASSDKLEQNVDENVRDLEDKVKELEFQLTKVKEAQQHIPTPMNSLLTMIDPAHKTLNALQTKLSDLQRDLANKSGNGQDLKAEQELTSSIQVQLETLITDIKRKYELIDNLKRDLVDKGTMQQKLKEKEAEASILKVQLIQFEEHNRNLSREIEELQTRILSADPSNNSGELLKELKDVKERESQALNRLKTLKSEEENLRNDIERMRKVEIAQREKITVLEARLVEKGCVADENLIKLRTELALTKEAEIVNNRTIMDLETKLSSSISDTEVSEDSDSLTDMKNKLAESKAADSHLRKTVQELESKLSTAEEQSNNLQTLKDEITLLKNSKDEQKSVIEQLQAQIQETLESKKTDQKTIAELEEQLTKVESQLLETLESGDKHSKSVIELENKLKEANDVLAEKENLLSTKNASLSESEATIQKIQAELEDIKSNKQISDERIKELEIKLEAAEKQTELLKELQAELEQAKDHTNKQEELIKTLESKLKQAEIQKDDTISKLEMAEEEIKKLKDQCSQLQNELNEVHKDTQNINIVDSKMVEDLTEQLNKVQSESSTYKERVQELENTTQLLRSSNEEHVEIKGDLNNQVERLQRELESLAEEFAEAAIKYEDSEVILQEQKNRIVYLEETLEIFKNQNGNSTNTDSSGTGLAQLAAENEILRHTNDDLNTKISEAEDHMLSLNERITTLQRELENAKSSNNNNQNLETAETLKEKINELEMEKQALEEANASYMEDRKRLDQKIESLTQQLTSAGKSGNKTAAQLADLNGKISALENEIGQVRQKSREEIAVMEKEMMRQLEINEQLMQGKGDAALRSPKSPNDDDQTNSLDSGYISGSTRTLNNTENVLQNKFLQQENTINQQNDLIKTLQDKVNELERRSPVLGKPVSAELDAVGGDSRKNSIRHSDLNTPPTPPPTQPLPLPPTSPSSPHRESQELSLEIQRLNKRIETIEGENLQNCQLVETLEESLNDTEKNLQIARQELQVLQHEKLDLVNQVKNLKSQLEDATIQFERTRSSVQQEKAAIEAVLDKERRAKQSAERAKLLLESQMEQLMAKGRSKFMCF